MDRFIDRIYPDRSKLIRQPNPQEFKATTMMGMEIEHASGKIRDKHVADEEEDYAGVPRLVRALSRDAGDRRAVGMRAPAPRPRAARRAWPTSSPATRLDELMTKSYRRTFG